MTYVKCKCGSGIGVPDDFVGSLGECPDCRRTFRIAAAPGQSIAGDELDARLNILAGPQRLGEQLILRGSEGVEVGKLPGKPIELVGTLVSRNHCRLLRGAEGWRVEDHKSTNGLIVNGKRVATADLRNGDRIRVGEYELEYAICRAEESSLEQEQEAGHFVLEEIEDVYDLAEEPAIAQAAPNSAIVSGEMAFVPAADGDPCPSCGKRLPARAKICIDCGIDIHTGRALLVSSDVDENSVHAATESAVRAISWVIPFGLYPIKSEGYGNFKPYAVWTIAAVTVLVTVMVWIMHLSGADGVNSTRNLMMWGGREPTASDIERGRLLSRFTHWGDAAAFDRKVAELRARNLSGEEAEVKAYNELDPDQQFFGQFHWYQLLTNGLLHQNILHIAGNLLFLLVFGSRVNALIGQWRTAVLYIVLLVVASAAELLSLSGHAPLAALGASGAIMGMAGMYFVLMPVHRVYLTIWFRFVLWIFVPIWWTRAFFKVFALRGFWVVLFYIAFDVLATVLGSKDGVAHWAHLGGFIGGMVLALVLLLARQVDAKGGDLLSAMLGRRAWLLLGKPGHRQIRMEAAALVS
ncbi:MAG TPA: rhomboid family intramembrane serine protease [Tepidisphaeraceae bacterium]|jgi:membrane associated rhomboid family serine protease/pSer/pThr/pTyr-binding forkhead associated (FHA) protein